MLGFGYCCVGRVDLEIVVLGCVKESLGLGDSNGFFFFYVC